MKTEKLPRYAVRRFMPLHNDGSGAWQKLTENYKLLGAARNAYQKMQKADPTHKHIVVDELNRVQVFPPVASPDGKASREA